MAAFERDTYDSQRADLAQVPVPKETETYVPISHDALVETLASIGQNILGGFRLEHERFSLARGGQQLFGVLMFADGSEFGLAIVFRNSYARSLSLGTSAGAYVSAGENLALVGDIVLPRKHTPNVRKSLEDTAIQIIYRSRNNLDRIIGDSECLKRAELDDDQAFAIMGQLYGRKIISPRQLTAVRDEWVNPRQKEFLARNSWSLYNCCSKALRGTPPLVIMDKHIQLHAAMMGLIGKN